VVAHREIWNQNDDCVKVAYKNAYCIYY